MNEYKNKDGNTRHNITFSLLDFGLRYKSMNTMKITDDVINYAVAADRLGFKRIWLAEHHVSDSMAAWFNPMILLPILAGMTKKITVGVAGTQLNIHNSYHTAINYKLLANLFPNRIDLGIAGGSVEECIKDYLPNEKYSFNEKRKQLIQLLRDEDHLAETKQLIIPPFKGYIPNIWLLSSNYEILSEVLEQRASFSRSLFHGWNLAFDKERLDIFRQAYLAKYNIYPDITLAFSGCIHHSDNKAKKVAEESNYQGISRINIVGSAERFKDEILRYRDEYGFNEFTFLNVARMPKDRIIALNLIQKSFNF